MRSCTSSCLFGCMSIMPIIVAVISIVVETNAATTYHASGVEINIPRKKHIILTLRRTDNICMMLAIATRWRIDQLCSPSLEIELSFRCMCKCNFMVFGSKWKFQHRSLVDQPLTLGRMVDLSATSHHPYVIWKGEGKHQ